MPHLPALRVVPLEKIRPHEEFDPLRVERLVGRITEEGIQVNPMMCFESVEGELVLLDGATRTESLRRVGVPHTVVQIVPPTDVTLETWHHVVRNCHLDEFAEVVAATDVLTLSDGPGTPQIHHPGGSSLVESHDVSSNTSLARLVASYVGKWQVGRVPEPSIEAAQRFFPDWAVLVEFPTFTIERVLEAAITDDLLPAGVTRFLVQERALRLNVGLDMLGSAEPTEVKQDQLESLIRSRIDQGRVRRYEETVVILDD